MRKSEKISVGVQLNLLFKIDFNHMIMRCIIEKNTFRLSKYYKDCDHCNCIEIKPFEHEL